jgi:hypothetical protein
MQLKQTMKWGTHQPERQLAFHLQGPLPPLLPDAFPRRVLAGAASSSASRWGVDNGPSRRHRDRGYDRRRRLRHHASRERLRCGPLALGSLAGGGQTTRHRRRATARPPGGRARHRREHTERRGHRRRHCERVLRSIYS